MDTLRERFHRLLIENLRTWAGLARLATALLIAAAPAQAQALRPVPGSPFKIREQGHVVVLSPDETRLFASVDDPPTIQVVNVGAAGALTVEAQCASPNWVQGPCGCQLAYPVVGSYPPRPTSIALNPSGTRLYVASANHPGLHVFDVAQNGALTLLQGAVSLSSGSYVSLPWIAYVSLGSGHYLFVNNNSGYGANVISVFAVDRNGTLVEPPLDVPTRGSADPSWFFGAPRLRTATVGNKTLLFALNEGSSDVSVFDVTTFDIAKGVLDQVAGSPFPVRNNVTGGIAVDATGQHLYAADHLGYVSKYSITEGGLILIDTASGFFWSKARSLELRPGGGELLVTSDCDQGDTDCDLLAVVNTATMTLRSGSPQPADSKYQGGITFDKSGKRAFVGVADGIAVYDFFSVFRNVRDFDGDAKSDATVFRPSSGVWYQQRSSSGSGYATAWGIPGDVPVPGDYDGDNRTDTAVFRPASGAWFVLQSSTGTGVGVPWGVSDDVPVPADYDGDGKTDVAVWRPSTGVWYIIRSASHTAVGIAWGVNGDVPVPADFDGDGKADPAVFRPSSGTWYELRSTTGVGYGISWGQIGDVPLASDYDGDGKADPTVFRASTGMWYELRSSTGTGFGVIWGAPNDVPIVGDYDGDGKADPTVFRPSTGTWYELRSTTGAGYGMSWGQGGDVPM